MCQNIIQQTYRMSGRALLDNVVFDEFSNSEENEELCSVERGLPTPRVVESMSFKSKASMSTPFCHMTTKK